MRAYKSTFMSRARDWANRQLAPFYHNVQKEAAERGIRNIAPGFNENDTPAGRAYHDIANPTAKALVAMAEGMKDAAVSLTDPPVLARGLARKAEEARQALVWAAADPEGTLDAQGEELERFTSAWHTIWM